MTKKFLKLLVWVFFFVLTAWWLYINAILQSSDPSNLHNQLFGASYGVISILGGFIGIMASKQWGGNKSLVGRALLYFACGLLAQELGQLIYSVYTHVLQVDIPYPSLGDIGYFGSVLFYIYAALQLAKAAGVRFSLKNRSKQIIAVSLPLILLTGSYLFFLAGYEFELSSARSALKIFLDFGYPLSQAGYLSIALLTYLLSKNLLGGVMKNKILFILVALLAQYIADAAFLYAANMGTAFPGGVNDFLYLVAYTAMALALNSFRLVSFSEFATKVETNR